jgi:hypothetical protein
VGNDRKNAPQCSLQVRQQRESRLVRLLPTVIARSFHEASKELQPNIMRTLINVYGTARSGSTLLDLTLGNAPDAFSCGEVSAWFRPYRNHHFKLECACGQKPCPTWARIGFVAENRFHITAFSELQVSLLVDSSKDICWLIDTQKWLRDTDVRTVNLLLWKDPIDLAYSFWKRGKGTAAWRTEFLKCYTYFFDTGLPFLAVKYNDFARSPQQKVAQICTAAGIPPSQGRERLWDKQHHHLFGSAGIREQMQAKESVIEAKSTRNPEFDKTVERLQEQLAGDHPLQRVLETLSRADVSLFDVNAEGAPDQNARHPLWYYRKRAIRTVRRYFPEKYNPSAP